MSFPKLDCLFCSAAVPVIAIPLALRCAAPSTVYDSHRRQTTGLVFFLVVKTKRFETGLRRGFR
jgi:hypothetical protein